MIHHTGKLAPFALILAALTALGGCASTTGAASAGGGANVGMPKPHSAMIETVASTAERARAAANRMAALREPNLSTVRHPERPIAGRALSARLRSIRECWRCR